MAKEAAPAAAIERFSPCMEPDASIINTCSPLSPLPVQHENILVGHDRLPGHMFQCAIQGNLITLEVKRTHGHITCVLSSTGHCGFGDTIDHSEHQMHELPPSPHIKAVPRKSEEFPDEIGVVFLPLGKRQTVVSKHVTDTHGVFPGELGQCLPLVAENEGFDGLIHAGIFRWVTRYPAPHGPGIFQKLSLELRQLFFLSITLSERKISSIICSGVFSDVS